MIMVLGIILAACSLQINAQTIIVLAVEDSWVPYSDRRGNGISKKLVTQAFQAVNRQVEYKVFPYARALRKAEQGVVDGVFNVTKQENTMNTFHFGQEPLLQADTYFYYPPGSKLDYQSSREIPENTKIAVIIGYEYGDEYESNKHRILENRVSKQKQIIHLLRSKRVDMAIMFEKVAEYNLLELGFLPSAIKKGHLNNTSQIYVAFNKKRVDLSVLLDRGLRKIRRCQLPRTSTDFAELCPVKLEDSEESKR